jgi:hypothetical protein
VDVAKVQAAVVQGSVAVALVVVPNHPPEAIPADDAKDCALNRDHAAVFRQVLRRVHLWPPR